MEKKQPGAIIMAVGGALMAVGSFMTWLTLKIDVTAFTDAIKQQTGIDLGGAPGLSTLQKPTSVAGTKGWEGKLALVAGILVLAVAIAAIAGAVSGSKASRVAFIGAALGIFGVAYVLLTKSHELSNGISDAKISLAPSLATIGIGPSVFDHIFSISNGIGLYVAIAGGVVAIVGGVMLMGKGAAAPATMGTGEPMAAPPVGGSGFGGPAAPTPPMSPPPMSPPADTPPPMSPPEETPAAPPMPQEPPQA